MGIENTTIFKEMQAVPADGSKPVTFQVKAEIYAGGTVVNVFRVVSQDISRRYHENFSDVIMIECLVPLGDFHEHVLTNKDNLEVVVYKYAYKEDGNTVDLSRKIESQRYRAFIKEEPTPNIQKASRDNISTAGSNLTGFKKLYIQLIDIVAYKLMKQTVGGTFVNEVPGDVLWAVLGEESYRAGGPGEQAVRGVDIVKPYSNTKPSEHILIPHDVSLVDLPIYIQSCCDGVYSTGMGYYLQKGLWYVYPAADTERFNKSEMTLTVLNVPSNKMPHVERTYRQTNGQVIALCTGGMKHYDNSEETQQNEGNGARIASAGKAVQSEFGLFKDEQYFIARKENNSEFYSYQRKDGVNKAAFQLRAFSSNPHVTYTKIAFRECAYVDLVWQNSNDSLIYPGMPAKLMYENNGVVEEVLGVVHAANHFITGSAQSMVDNPHKTITVITLLIKKQV